MCFIREKINVVCQWFLILQSDNRAGIIQIQGTSTKREAPKLPTTLVLHVLQILLTLLEPAKMQLEIATVVLDIILLFLLKTQN